MKQKSIKTAIALATTASITLSICSCDHLQIKGINPLKGLTIGSKENNEPAETSKNKKETNQQQKKGAPKVIANPSLKQKPPALPEFPSEPVKLPENKTETAPNPTDPAPPKQSPPVQTNGKPILKPKLPEEEQVLPPG